MGEVALCEVGVLTGVAVILLWGFLRYGSALPGIILAALILAANFVLEIGHSSHWWEQAGFLSFTTWYVMFGVVLLIMVMNALWWLEA